MPLSDLIWLEIISVELTTENGVVDGDLGDYIYGILYEYVADSLNMTRYDTDLVWWLAITIDETDNSILIIIYTNKDNENFDEDIYDILTSDAFETYIQSSVSDYDDDMNGMLR